MEKNCPCFTMDCHVQRAVLQLRVNTEKLRSTRKSATGQQNSLLQIPMQICEAEEVSNRQRRARPDICGRRISKPGGGKWDTDTDEDS